MYLFCNSVLSYFAKPNFIVYDEWFDNDLKKTKLNVKNKKITNISKIHEFFYEQSNYKVGASENILQIEIDENREEIFNNYYLAKTKQNSIIKLFCLESVKEEMIKAEMVYSEKIANETCESYYEEFTQKASHQDAKTKCKFETKESLNQYRKI